MSFTKLAAELQIEIFSYLSNTDLKAVRGVSTSCRDNASVWLFHSIVACARYQAMGAFQKISLHPSYQKYVKEIVFDASEYEKILATKEDQYKTRAQHNEETREHRSWIRHSNFKKYQLLYREQEELKYSGILLQTIVRALEWMPNVDKIVYCSRPRLIPVESKDLRGILPRSMTPARNSDRSRMVAQTGISDNHQNGFDHLIAAINVSQYCTIRELRIQACQESDWESAGSYSFGLGDFLFAQFDYIESVKHFFRSLQKIELDLDTGYNPSPHKSLANMRALLAEAKDLRHLRLRLLPNKGLMTVDHLARVTQSESPFTCFGLATEWPELQSIELHAMCATEDELRDLVARHMNTLSSMKFSECVLTSGKWSNLTDDVLYGTAIGTFVLDRVNENVVGGSRFSHLKEERKKGKVHL